MLAKTCLLSLSLLLFAGAAAAQTPSGSNLDGRRQQPIQRQIGQAESAVAHQRDRSAPLDIDRLYDEIMRASSRPSR